MFIHITLETAPNEMQCDETISHMVTAGRSYLRILRNACVTAGKTTMTAGKIYHGCFEMLSWPHRTSANIINTCFCLLETCTKCSYFKEVNIWPDAQRLAFEVKYEYIVCRPRIYCVPAFCGWASFQITGVWCVKIYSISFANLLEHWQLSIHTRTRTVSGAVKNTPQHI